MFQEIFGVNKPIIGMVHLKKLPGNKYFGKETGMEYAISKAKKDIEALQEGGIDGICIENWEEDAPEPFIRKETAKGLEILLKEVLKETKIPAGLNILHNDYRMAFSLAEKFDLKFVWLDVFVDRVRTDFGHSKIKPFEIDVNTEEVRKWKKKSGNIPLFVQVHPKHYYLLEEGKSIELSARQAIDNGADAIVITKSTGIAPAIELIQQVKDYVGDFPVLVGSGVTPENIKSFLSAADGAILGTSLKTKNFDRIVKSKVKYLMGIVREIRSRR